MKKTNAVRLLDKAKVPYKLIEYVYDPERLSVPELSAMNNWAVETVYKTLVIKGDKTGILVVVIPGDKNLDLKAIAKVSRNKKVAMVQVKEINKLMGYIRGGCSPLGMKKNYPVFIDSAAMDLEGILVNAGQRGLMLVMSGQDLERVTRATVATISS